jgi:hypothetical protein
LLPASELPRYSHWVRREPFRDAARVLQPERLYLEQGRTNLDQAVEPVDDMLSA